MVSLIYLLPISNEAQNGILFGFGVSLVVIGYFLVRRRNPPKTTQKIPTTSEPINCFGDSCNHPDMKGRKPFSVPNLLRKKFTNTNIPSISKIIPTTWLIALVCSAIMNKIISYMRLGVNHNVDTRSKTFYPLAKRLEGRVDGTLVQKGNRGIN